jgi:hypothetical protein
MCVCVSLSPLCPSLNFLASHVCGAAIPLVGEKWCFQQNNVALAQMLIYWAVPDAEKQKCRRETGAEEREFAPASPPPPLPPNVRTHTSPPVYEWAKRKTLSQQVSSTPSILKTSMVFYPTDVCPTHVKWNCICLGSQDALILHVGIKWDVFPIWRAVSKC